MTENDNFLLISGIQNFSYCKRRWALVHIEGMWDENALTIEGQLMHERVHDSEFTQLRGNTILSRGMAVSSKLLGITGACDMVELRSDPSGTDIFGRVGRYCVYPVEYKHGSCDRGGADELQLCAQAVCLEEMLCTDIPTGAIYYAQTRRRQEIDFTEELRGRLTAIITEMHRYMDSGYTPKVKRSNRCVNCSMINLCFPELLSAKSAKTYILETIREDRNA